MRPGEKAVANRQAEAGFGELGSAVNSPPRDGSWAEFRSVAKASLCKLRSQRELFLSSQNLFSC